jgi:hypothetical protein
MMPESYVDLHLVRAIEKSEQAVADHSRLVEPVDQNARSALGTSATR